MKRATVLVFLAANGLALIGRANPWLPAWRTAGTVFLVLEAAFGLLIGLPVFLYHWLGKKKPPGRSLNDTVESILGFLAGWV